MVIYVRRKEEFFGSVELKPLHETRVSNLRPQDGRFDDVKLNGQKVRALEVSFLYLRNPLITKIKCIDV